MGFFLWVIHDVSCHVGIWTHVGWLIRACVLMFVGSVAHSVCGSFSHLHTCSFIWAWVLMLVVSVVHLVCGSFIHLHSLWCAAHMWFERVLGMAVQIARWRLPAPCSSSMFIQGALWGSFLLLFIVLVDCWCIQFSGGFFGRAQLREYSLRHI